MPICIFLCVLKLKLKLVSTECVGVIPDANVRMVVVCVRKREGLRVPPYLFFS